jgi:hypothetical protein
MKLPKINIPDGKNLALVAIAILLMLYAARQIISYLQKVRAAINVTPTVNPVNLTYQSGQYDTWADQLESILQQWPTLDEDQIVKILQRLRTTDDWYELVRAFGIRKISRLILGNFEGNLIEWFSRRLSTKEMKKISDTLKGVGVYV